MKGILTLMNDERPVMTLTEKFGEDPSRESSDTFARIFIFLIPACICQILDHHEIEIGLWPRFHHRDCIHLALPFLDQRALISRGGAKGYSGAMVGTCCVGVCS